MVALKQTSVHFTKGAPDPDRVDGTRGRGVSSEGTHEAARTEVVA
jgi:hypothetical protein